MAMRAARLLALACLVPIVGCTTPLPIRTVEQVDLQRFMGDWYVIAAIPTFLERNAHNAVESYTLEGDGTIATVFTFNDGGFDGERKRYNPRGYVRDRDSNAVWGMQFVWPFKAEYRIVYLAEDYSLTVIGRSKRDYAWIMARTPTVPEHEYRSMVTVLADAGYDVARVRKVPQRWSQ